MSARAIIDFLDRAASARLCIICGAKVINHNPQSEVCGDDVCHVARNEGVSYAVAHERLTLRGGEIRFDPRDTIEESKMNRERQLARLNRAYAGKNF